jgi:hypothetical protein
VRRRSRHHIIYHPLGARDFGVPAEGGPPYQRNGQLPFPAAAKGEQLGNAEMISLPKQTQNQYATDTVTQQYEKYLREYTIYRNKCISIIRTALQDIRDDLHKRELMRQRKQSLTNFTNTNHTNDTTTRSTREVVLSHYAVSMNGIPLKQHAYIQNHSTFNIKTIISLGNKDVGTNHTTRNTQINERTRTSRETTRLDQSQLRTATSEIEKTHTHKYTLTKSSKQYTHATHFLNYTPSKNQIPT